MGKRGPIGASTRVLKLKGDYRPDRHASRDAIPQPDPLTALPKAPAYLGALGKKEWRRVGAELVELGLLTSAGLSAFGFYCLACQRALEAELLLVKADSLTVTTARGGIRPHPTVNIARQAWSEVRKWGAEFGLSPSTRTRVRVPAKKPTPVRSGWEALD
jgi:P27 family predicted phage terminase small subunit